MQLIHRKTILQKSSIGSVGGLLLCAMVGCSGSNEEPGVSSGGATIVANGGAASTGGGASSGIAGSTQVGGAKQAGGATTSGGAGITSAIGGAATTGGNRTSGGAGQTGGSAQTGGIPGMGGTTANGGTATSGGNQATGGIGQTGGSAQTGGTPAVGGRTATGGMVATGGVPGTGGGSSGSSSLGFSYYLGADVTFEESAPESTRANLLTILKSHGFNSIRLRTFVDPKAADGYDKTNGIADLAHTIAFGKQIKSAGMGLLVDFHYSDNWADPGKQCVPIAWQKYTTIAQLATAVHDYTKDAITKLIAAGARPDMVQIGNETTRGMLIHRCDSGGQPTGNNPITGSTSNWANLGPLLKAGVDAVKGVDPTILTSFHIDKGGDKAGSSAGSALQTSVTWLTNALKYTPVDAFGESNYQRYQGDPNSTANTVATWKSTMGGLASRFPNIKFFSAEYGPMQREINDVVFNLPNQQGLGTFNWEPTVEGAWNTGHLLLRRSGNTYTAQPDLALYAPMKTAYASRL